VDHRERVEVLKEDIAYCGIGEGRRLVSGASEHHQRAPKLLLDAKET
jgi:hypothetical protein